MLNTIMDTTSNSLSVLLLTVLIAIGKRLYTTKVPISRGISQKLGEGQSQDEASTFAILDYHEESLRTSSIDIKNPALKKGLTDVLSNYPDTSIHTISGWDRFLQAEKASSEGTNDLFRILRHHLERGLKEPFRVLRDYQRTKYIEFDDLLVAVVPGELVVRYRIGLLWAGVFLAASIGEFWSSKSCDLKVRVMNWDGTCFGYREKTWEIRAFQGFRKITDLPVFPLDADSDRDQIEQRLVGRGRMFHRLCSQHVKVYTGVVHFKLEGRKMRIIVDAYAFYKFQYKYVPQLSDLNGEEGLEGPDPHSIVSNDYSSTQQSTFLTEEEYIIAIPYVRRFALKSMTWYKLDISNISHMMWNEKLLGNLVIQDQEKRLPLALVQDQGSHEDDKFDDFIEDKGKGLILLLAGPPGVGKTPQLNPVLTEELERPLYRVNADEADVLLEKRSSDRCASNELYYTDALILTTNRCGDIYPVFESRIDIILTYNNLDKDSRRQIWSNLIARFQKDSTDINNLDLDSLSNWEVNGRQNKSAIKAARIIAKSKSAPLGIHHLEDVLEIRKRGSRVIGTEIIH
ncbi:hypothetical protein NOF04DRAFT_1348975 [Fusarium oxysporum II5]|nr:hypothetical protein NOF04DRAFT_1348975 [Fusarium oxysporum II5]